MTIREFLSKWLQANRAFLSSELDTKKIHDQTEISPLDFYEKVHSEYSPCFVLSTGRCGTKLLTKVLEAAGDVVTVHSPTPEPAWHASWAYRHFEDKTIIGEVADAMRYEIIRNSWLLGRQYVETNNRITFFAPGLAARYPKAKFIHLYRHPHAVVKSGFGRKWYSGEVINDEGRITPKESSVPEWQQWGQVKKIAWLWNETNQYIENFKQSVAPERCLTVKAEEFFKDPSVTAAIFDFIEMQPKSTKWIERQIKQPVNKQSKKKKRNLLPRQMEDIDNLTPLMLEYYPKTSS